RLVDLVDQFFQGGGNVVAQHTGLQICGFAQVNLRGADSDRAVNGDGALTGFRNLDTQGVRFVVVANQRAVGVAGFFLGAGVGQGRVLVAAEPQGQYAVFQFAAGA